ncbi:MAG TPA: hypothetical protein VFO98_09470 [Marmoricola sp.]|nr:hypothetical protein [Marmoricola sp.]
MTNSLEPSNHFPSASASSSTPSWWWRLENASGVEVTVAAVPAQEFPSQSDAESWVGEVWRELLEGGADAVTLFEGDRLVYGPMSLHAS